MNYSAFYDTYNLHRACSYRGKLIAQFKTSTFGLLLLKIVVKMTFLRSKITVLKTFLLLLFAMLLLMLLYYFLVLAETNFSSSRRGKVDLISLLFPPLLILKFVSTHTFFALLLLEHFSFLTATATTSLYFCTSVVCFDSIRPRLLGKFTNFPTGDCSAWLPLLPLARHHHQLIADFHLWRRKNLNTQSERPPSFLF